MNQAVAYINDAEEEEEATGVLYDLVKQGVIQRFEYTHELAWNVMKDYAK